LAVNYQNWTASTVFYEQQAIAKTMPNSVFYGPGYCYNTNSVPEIIRQTFGEKTPEAVFCYINERRLLDEPLNEEVVSRYGLEGELRYFPKKLNEVRVPKIAWINDFWHCTPQEWEQILIGNGFDVAFATYCPPFVSREIFDSFFSRRVQERVKFIPWPRAVNPEIYKDYNLQKEYDITSLGAMNESFYPLRSKMHREFSSMADIRYFHQQHPGYKFISNQGVLAGVEYAKAINRSKIFASCTGKYHIPFIKLYEVMACGTVLMCDKPTGGEYLGLKAGENYAAVSEDNFINIAKQYLSQPQEIDRLARNAKELFLARHTVNVRAEEFKRTISDILRGREPQGWAELWKIKSRGLSGTVLLSNSSHLQLNKAVLKPVHIKSVSRPADEQTLSIWNKYGLNYQPHEKPPVITENPELVVLRGVYLRQLAEQVGAKYLAEVGTARGYQSMVWAQYLIDTGRTDGLVYTCDINGMNERIYKTPLAGNQILTRQELWQDAPGAKHIKFTHGNSGKLASSIGHKLDMVYIDGEHTGQAVKSDFENLQKLLRPGAIVIFDDCDERFPGIQQAVNQISAQLNVSVQIIEFSPGKYKIAVVQMPSQSLHVQIADKQNDIRKTDSVDFSKPGVFINRLRAEESQVPKKDEFEYWYEQICIDSVLQKARQNSLLWEGKPLEWDAAYEILAYHEFCGGSVSLEQLLQMSNNRYKLLDEIWPKESLTKEKVEQFYLDSYKILPWGHGIFMADHKVQERRRVWLRRLELLKMLRERNVKSLCDFGAGGGYTSLLAAAMDFERVVHHEYSIFYPYVIWRAEQMKSASQTNCQLEFTNAENPLVLSEPVDAVICTDVAEHVWNPVKMLEEIRRALKPGGILVWASFFGEGLSCHLHPDLKGKEEQLLQQAGFKRIGNLPVAFNGHCGLYESVPVGIGGQQHGENLKNDKIKITTGSNTSKSNGNISEFDLMKDVLERNQWLSPAEIEQNQFGDLRKLLEHSYKNVPFYRRRFDSIGLNLRDIKSMDDFRRIPILKKSDIQRNLQILRAINCPPEELIRDATGGSTGEPLIFYRDLNAKRLLHYGFLRFREGWMGYHDSSSKVAFIWGAERDFPKKAPPNQRWLNSFHCTEDEIEKFIDELVRWQPDAIRAYASSLHMVASYIKKKGLNPPRPKVIESAAEKLWPWQRKLAEEVFGCKVYEQYGSREMPVLACECEYQNGMHIFSDMRLIEIIKDGRPAQPGEEGSIVITDLINYGMPFIRYQIGDVGIISKERCPCGRGFPLLKEVKGRVTSTIRTPEGKLVHGEYFTHLFYNVPGIRAFQVHQTKLDEIIILIQPDVNFDKGLIEPIIQQMRFDLGGNVRIEWKCVDDIPKTSSGKRHFVLSDVPVDFLVGNETQNTQIKIPAADNKSDLKSENPARKKILFVVDSPGWAHDHKTNNIIRCLGDSYDFRKVYNDNLTAGDIDNADLVLVYYWSQLNGLKIDNIVEVLMRNKHKLLIGICSGYEMGGSREAEGLKTIHNFASGVFINCMLLHEAFSPRLNVPVFYTPNGVDTKFFFPINCKLGSDKMRIGWAGSLKNHGAKRGFVDFIIPAIKSMDGVELFVAAREDKWRSYEEMRTFYRILDVYICASSEEGTPNPCLEAAACGVPLLTTRVGNMPELIKDGQNGFFIERNVEDIANKIKLLRDDIQLRKRLSSKILESIKQWDWSVQAENYRKMFKQMLQKQEHLYRDAGQFEISSGQNRPVEIIKPVDNNCIEESETKTNLGGNGERVDIYYRKDIDYEELDKYQKSHYRRYQFAQSMIEHGKVVGDFACGTGYGSVMLAEKANYVIGADINEEVIKNIRERYRDSGNVEFIHSNLLDLQFESFFDYIISFETIEHLNENDISKLLHIYSRALKPGGSLIFSTPYIQERSETAIKRGFHQTFYIDQAKINKWLTESGFEAECFKYQNYQTHDIVECLDKKDFIICTARSCKPAYPKELKPKVSILIPTYNRSQYLKKAIDSAISQNYPNIEIVVLDDCSTDDTAEAVKVYSNISNFKYIRNEQNIGFIRNWNRAMLSSCGEYIKLMGDDDILRENCIAEQMKILDEHRDVGVVCCDYFVVDEAGNIKDVKDGYRIFNSDRKETGWEFMENYFAGKRRVGWPTSMLFRREDFEKVGVFDIKTGVAADIDMWCRILSDSSFYYIDKKLAYNRQFPGNLSKHLSKDGSQYFRAKTLANLKKRQEQEKNSGLITAKEPHPELYVPYYIESFDSYEIREVALESLKANIKGLGFIPISETPHYKYLTGDRNAYIYYQKKYFGVILTVEQTVEVFERLAANFAYGSKMASGKISLILAEPLQNDTYRILDGVHRAAILMHEGIKKIKIAVPLRNSKAAQSFKGLAFEKKQVENLALTNDLAMGLGGLIFSKDRAMQLRAALDSMFLHCSDLKQADLFVLYRTSSKRHYEQYRQLKEIFPQVLFVEEHDFKNQVLSIVKSYEYILFLVDDTLFVRSFNFADIISSLAGEKRVLGFSLRLGTNTNYCYSRNCNQKLPDFEEIRTGILKYSWPEEQCNFSYPLEVSSSVYRSRDILPLIEKVKFANPNQFESALNNAKNSYQSLPYLFTFKNSVAFCNPVNIVVQDAYKNRFGEVHNYTAESLADAFSKGMIIDVKKYAGFLPNAAHQEVPIHFKEIGISSLVNTASNASGDSEKKPKISVLIAVHNCYQFIGQALDSIYNQTFQDFELVIVDDASTDKTSEVILKKKDSRTVVYRNDQNLGLTKSLNIGIKLCRGEFVARMDADDISYPQRFEKQIRFFESHPDAIVLGSWCDRIDEAGNKIGAYDTQPTEAEQLKQELLRFNSIAHGTAMVRRYAIVKAGGYREDYKRSQDHDLWLRLSEIGNLYNLPEHLYALRTWGGSITKNTFVEQRRYSQLAIQEAMVRRSMLPNDKNLSSVKLFIKAMEEFDSGNFEDAFRSMHQYRTTINYKDFPRFVKYEKADNVNVSVIIVTFGRTGDIKKCIESLLKQHSARSQYEVIVIDNGFTDENIIKPLCDQYIKCPVNLGLSEGRNIGACFARGRILAFLDDDALVGPDYISSIKEAFDTYDIFGFRGKVLPKTSNETNQQAVNYDRGDEVFCTFCDQEGNSAFLTEVYLNANGMDPLLFGAEGTDLTYRIIEKYNSLNKIIYWPKTIIYHDNAPQDVQIEKQKRYELMRQYFYLKHSREISEYRKEVEEKQLPEKRHFDTEKKNVHVLPRKSCSEGNEIPVALITYNRPKHTYEVLNALKEHNIKNIYIFSDGPKKDEDVEKVQVIRKLARTIDWTKPKIIEQPENVGLARNIVGAADHILAEHDRLIVLEDDCVPQKYFFDFMRGCLDRYEGNENIFGISGYTVQIPEPILKQWPYDLYFYPRMGSCGWATWKRAWQYREKDLRAAYQKAQQKNIDVSQGGNDVPVMIEQFLTGRLKEVWTLNWVLTVYLHNGYYIYPTQSHIKNIGFDGSGVHVGKSTKFDSKIADSKPQRFPDEIIINEAVYNNFRSFYDIPGRPRSSISIPSRGLNSPAAGSTVTASVVSSEKPLKIVHVCTHDHGGAGKAAYRLHKSLQSIGHDSSMLVISKKTDDPSVHIAKSSVSAEQIYTRNRMLLEQFPNRPAGLEMYSDNFSASDLAAEPLIQQADIVNLHWVAGMLNYNSIRSALKNKAVVWTLHDMNPFTGGCHYAGDCERYKQNCGQCFQLGSNQAQDLSWQVWQQKSQAYNAADINIVTPSRWLADCSKNSSLFCGFNTEVIPNSLPVDIYKPISKEAVRKALNIRADAKVILFGAGSIVNERKGFRYLLEALKSFEFDTSAPIYLATFGGMPKNIQIESKYPVYNFGHVSEEKDLALLYSMADVFVLPSLEDNLPNIILEAMACGTPVVSFRVGGIPDMVEHQKTGYLVSPRDIAGLNDGIKWVLSAASQGIDLSRACREKVERLYTPDVQAKSYENLYKRLSCKKSSVIAASPIQAKSNVNEDGYLVSAIVSTYNSERFIRGCLEDLENQTIADRIEIIVVNSGSRQNEESIVKEFQQRYKNIKYIKTEQRETIYQSWNRAIEIASGKYITIANADDRRRKDAIEVMVSILDANQDIALVYADQYETKVENETFENVTVSKENIYPNFERDVFVNLGWCNIGSQPMWRAEIHREIGNFDGNFEIAGDYDFLLRVCEKYECFHIPQVLGTFYRSAGKTVSCSNTFRLSRIENPLAKARSLVRKAVKCIEQADYSKAEEYLHKSINCWPSKEAVEGIQVVQEKTGQRPAGSSNIRFEFLASIWDWPREMLANSKAVPEAGQFVNSGSSKYLLSVIISGCKSSEEIDSCLAGLAAQSISNRTEVLVVAGTECQFHRNIEKYGGQFADISFVEVSQEENVWAGVNRALQKSAGEFVTILKPAYRYINNGLEKTIEILKQDISKAAVYSCIVDTDTVREKDIKQEELFTENLNYGRLIWRRCLHNQLGWFDESFYKKAEYEFWHRIANNFNMVRELHTLESCPCSSDEYDFDVSFETGLIKKAYQYASLCKIRLDSGGVSRNEVFSKWVEVNILKKRTWEKIHNRKYNPVSNIDDNRPSEISPLLSVIVVTCDRSQALIRNLDALSNQSEKNFDIIIVNNSSSSSNSLNNGSLNICQINLDNNYGPSLARNIGAEHSRSPYLVFLDDDAVPDRCYIEKIITHFRHHDICGLRGKILSPVGGYVPDMYDLGDEVIPYAADMEGNCAFKKEVFNQAGGFSEWLFHGEGMDLSYRIYMQQGEDIDKILYFPDVIIHHQPYGNQLYRLERMLRAELMEKLLEENNPGIKKYENYMFNFYPINRKNAEHQLGRLFNNAAFLLDKKPQKALEWAKLAKKNFPNVFGPRFILGSAYLKTGDFQDAKEELLELFFGMEDLFAQNTPEAKELLDDKNECIKEMYLQTVVRLSQCCLELGDYNTIKIVYEKALQNTQIEIPEQQRSGMEKLYRRLKTMSLPEKTYIPVEKPINISPAAAQKEYLVSAIVSTYNAEDLIRGCLEDLENQTIADKLEIIVVNSGSQQNEEAVVKEFQSKYDNIVYIKTEQREGIYTAWNRAVKASRGRFLTNANTDDRHRKDALEILSGELLNNPDVALVYADQIYTDTPNCTFEKHRVVRTEPYPDYSRERLLQGCCVGSQPMWRKSLHDELGYFDETLDCASDWDFWIRVSEKYTLKRVPEFLGVYYYNRQGIEHGRKRHGYYERYVVGKRYGTPYISSFNKYEERKDWLVSVIMPAYNCEKFIREAIESVLIQNYRNFELIIINDGSTDGTEQIIHSYKDEHIRYFKQENRGLAATHNEGIRQARGEFLVKVDTDDFITVDFIGKHLNEFYNHPDADLVYCDDYLIEDNGEPIRIIKRPEYTDRRMLIRDLFQCGFPVVPFRTCIRKRVFEKIGLFDDSLRMAEDYDMIRRFVKAGLKAHHLPAALYYRRLPKDSLSRKYTEEKIRTHFGVWRKFLETFSYEELFPDIDWEKMSEEDRHLHAKCLAASAAVRIGQSYMDTNVPLYTAVAIEEARSHLADCVQHNAQIEKLSARCEQMRHSLLNKSLQHT